MKALYDWDKVAPLIRAHMADANETVKDLNKGRGFYDWLRIGLGLMEWRDGAMELSGSQDTDSQAYRDAWGAAVPLYPQLAQIKDKSERSYSIWMWENHEVLEEWHAGLSDKQRRQWNHPRTVWNHSPLGKAAKDAQRSAPKKPATRDLHDAVNRIEGVADQIERTTGGAAALIFDMTPELISESARNFVEIYGKEDAARFTKELLALLAPLTVDMPEPTFDPAFTRSLTTKKRGSRKPAVKTASPKVRRGVRS